MAEVRMEELTSAVEALRLRADKLSVDVDTVISNDANSVKTVEPTKAMPDERELSPEDAEVYNRLVSTMAEAETSGDRKRIAAAEKELTMFQATLDVAIEFKIVDRPGENSGFWRSPTEDGRQKEYFVVVEAMVDGEAVNWATRDADTGKIVSSDKFGLRVDQETYSELSADKLSNGRIDRRSVGLKPIGRIGPVWNIKTDGETITGF